MVSGAQIFTEVSLSGSDQLLYDITSSGDKNSLTIDTTGQYASAPFSEIPTANSQIFFNGVKLIENIDYLTAGGFIPSGAITGATGVYFTYPAYSGGVSYTGSGAEPIDVTGDGFLPGGYVLFFNGIRAPVPDIIAHAANSDLISGTTVLSTYSLIYRMQDGNQINLRELEE